MDNSIAPNKRYRTTVLLLLTLIYTFNFVDRTIIGNLSPFIKDDLGLSDGQLGLLKGFLFALFYTVIGIPIAWLADRYSRVKIMSISLAIWSGFTALSGLATNFLQIGIARLGVGIGEAGGSPPAHSIISDLYPKEKRASALAIYALGIPIGVMFSFFAAGELKELFGWRGTFIALGVPGVILAMIVPMIIKEPKRGAMEAINNGGKAITKEPFIASLKTLLTIPSWWAMCFGIAFGSFAAYAASSWGVDYVTRHDPSYKTEKFRYLMNMLGLINGLAYGFGTYFGAVLADKMAKRYGVGVYALIPGLALMIGGPAFIYSFWVESVNSYLILVAIYLVAAGTYLGPSFAIAQTLAPISTRAMSTALFFLVLNIIGLGGGPTYIGFMSQYLTEAHGETHALRLAMSSLAVVFVISIIAFLWASRTLPKDWAIAEKRNEGLAKTSS
jgi:MFS family permease